MRFLIACLFAMTLIPAAQAAEPRVMMGYYASFGDLAVEDIPWQRLTHIAHAFLTTTDGGELQTTKLVPSAKLTKLAHQNNVRVLLCLGGASTTAGFEHVTNDPKRLKKYVKQVTECVVDNGYDGVDVDWEFPRDKETRQGLVNLIAAMRKSLDGAQKKQQREKPYLLTIAVSSSNYFGQWIDTKSIAPNIDWLNIMTYDMSGPWSRHAGHNSPLKSSEDDPERAWRSIEAAMDYWHKQREVPKEKLVVGLPFYGRAFPASEPYQELDPKKRKQHGSLTFVQARGLVKKGWKARWDDQIEAPWMTAPNEPLIVAYDDRNSIHRKTTWAREQSYRGVFFWALHQDRMPDGKHWLVEASHAAWPPATSGE